MDTNTRPRSRRSRLASRFPGALLWGCAGLCVSLAAALVLSVAVVRGADPLSLLRPSSLACLALGGFAGAFLAALKCEGNAFASAAVSALPLLLATLIAALAAPESRSFASAAVNVALTLAFAAAGAFAANALRGRRRKPRRKAARRSKRK